ncbi:hypothetical protein [Nocardia spumae]|uniref:hypothetical protein n=1 Tax=Nocardia spumae TaxID=2887190 RepID=UPI001D1344C3|nr:hypothetical protein [Nocardia spumae]
MVFRFPPTALAVFPGVGGLRRVAVFLTADHATTRSHDQVNEAVRDVREDGE